MTTFSSRVFVFIRDTDKGGLKLLEKLKEDERLTSNASASQGLQDMSLLFNYLDALDSAKTVVSPETD
jgi:hypothetical protein